SPPLLVGYAEGVRLHARCSSVVGFHARTAPRTPSLFSAAPAGRLLPAGGNARLYAAKGRGRDARLRRRLTGRHAGGRLRRGRGQTQGPANLSGRPGGGRFLPAR